MSKDTAEALAEAHEAYVAALLAHVTDEGGGEAGEGDPDPEDDPQAERKAELTKQTVAELRKSAKEAGASAKDIKECGTGASSKDALVALILTLEEPDPDGGTDDSGATDEDAPPAKSKKDKDKKKDKKKNKK